MRPDYLVYSTDDLKKVNPVKKYLSKNKLELIIVAVFVLVSSVSFLAGFQWSSNKVYTFIPSMIVAYIGAMLLLFSPGISGK